VLERKAGSPLGKNIFAAAALASTLVIAACGGGGGAGGGAAAQPKPTAPPVAIPITAEPVTRADILQTAAFTGSVTATNQISVLPQASGRLKDLFVDVTIHDKSSREALVVPSAAVLYDEQNMPFVYLQVRDG